MSKYCMGCMEQYEGTTNICPHCSYIDGTAAKQALHIQPGSILHDRYIVGTALGSGGFGVTYIAWDALLEQKVAIKEYLPTEFSTRMIGATQVTVYTGDKNKQFYDGLKRFLEEARSLAKLQNIDGIVRVFDCFEENNTAYIIMEYLEGETLAELLKKEKKYFPDTAISMLLPVIDSLAQVHTHGLIHRDIAPDNIFVTKDGTVKVIDFGAARYATTSHSRSLTVIIKPGYSPEEQYRSNEDQGAYTDVYALAATLYKMITGKTPPDALERRAYIERKNKDMLKPLSAYCPDIEENYENAILNAMNVRIEDRTASMKAFKMELTSTEPVPRIAGKIRKIDLLRWPLWVKVSVAAVTCLVITLCILLATGVFDSKTKLNGDITIPDGETRVPSVVNQTLEAAEKRLYESKLLYTISGKEYSKDIPTDYILTQDVQAGSLVVFNTNINVVISGGVKMARMPSVTNIPIDEAVELLENAGLVVSQIKEYSVAIEEGYVISQDIAADEEIAEETVVTLVVSQGIDPNAEIKKTEITLTDFTGKTYEEVLTIAESNGFKLSVSSHEHSTEYAANEIISQSPSAGSTIMTDETVTVVVSLGKEVVIVPDVQYQPKDEAKTTLENIGLKVTITEVDSDTIAAGLVISQSVAANTSVDPGTNITLTVSKGVGSFAMPNVVGMSELSAKNTLTDKGLSVSVIYEYSSKKSGIVLKQSISENTQVTKGTSVTITVSSGEETVTVPNVVGHTSSKAKTTLENKGFAVTVNKVYSDSVAADRVISQSPNGGSAQIKGSTVTLTVSLGKDTVQSISIASKPNKLNYFVGETLNPAGMTLTAKYKSGTTQSVTGGYTCNPTALNFVGTNRITVTYQAFTDTFNVTVSDIALESISIKTNPSKTTYYVGDKLDQTGLVLTATYSNGTTENITSGFTCSPATLSTAGTRTITVSYQGKTTTFTLTVQEVVLTSIAVKSKPSKTTYYVGDTLNKSGLVLTATYNNGTTENITSGFTCSPTTLNTAGTRTITVSYQGKTTTFTVNVIYDSIVYISSTSGSFRVVDTGVTITNSPTSVAVGKRVSLSVNHTWDQPQKTFTVKTNSSATIITASSSNTGVASVSVKQSNNVATITVTPMLIDYNVSKSATIYIYLNGEQKATYNASVYRPHSLSLKSSNSKLLYIQGEPFGDGAVWAVGTSDDPTIITSSNIAYLTVTTYNGNTATCAITITDSGYYTPSQTFNIRSGAGTNFSVIGSLPAGTTVQALGNYWDGTRVWAGIYYNGKYGWVARFDFSG